MEAAMANETDPLLRLASIVARGSDVEGILKSQGIDLNYGPVADFLRQVRAASDSDDDNPKPPSVETILADELLVQLQSGVRCR